ncbi:phosphopyruvate hydratase [Nanoarchaeota archaeon]
MNEITGIKAREVLDSRGNPTVEVAVTTGEKLGIGIVPSGASTGSNEALELRDNETRYLGKGVLNAVNNVNTIIAPKIIGLDVTDQKEIDKALLELDSSEAKSNLGANALLGVSLAACKAGALVKQIPLFEHIGHMIGSHGFTLPTPFLNIINGGEHADNDLSIQEYMIVPGGMNFAESLRMGSEVYHTLKKIINKKYGSANVGDEGGFAPRMKSYTDPFDAIMKALEELGYDKSVKLAIDAAASEFYKNGKYLFHGKKLKPGKMVDIYEKMAKDYPIISIEDPFNEDAFEDFAELNKRLKSVNVVGDDLLCTNPKRIGKAIEMKSCSCLLLKVNQIGTVTEAIEAAQKAMDSGWDVMVSHRSGESEDSFIADLAVGLSTGQLKAGAPCRGERTAKYNQLLRIEELLGGNSDYLGTSCVRKGN